MRNRWMLTVVPLLLSGALAQAADSSEPAEAAQLPVFKVGDQLVFALKDLLTKLPADDEAMIVGRVDEAGTTFVDGAGAIVRVYDGSWAATQINGVAYSPPIKALDFPLAPGKSWSHENSSLSAACGKQTTKLKSEVKGWEEVEVPAGRFKALRIDSKGYWRNGCGNDQLSYRFWYAPAVKSIVKNESIIYAGGRMFSGTLSELKSYKLD
ncbi:hypothetical protein RQP53_15670 [Paucibacter sp. APW11]|uniref:Uncharacterized protein n=1 Tax=Roseateles aquae TaxID=3077235 RepID=A0ABU3PDT2_9BURK|nr:hypothetical protein [Paucibacter sp. APW11]MDT9000714.1 hypothetical protein [Paucibacter sp. APW11]